MAGSRAAGAGHAIPAGSGKLAQRILEQAQKLHFQHRLRVFLVKLLLVHAFCFLYKGCDEFILEREPGTNDFVFQLVRTECNGARKCDFYVCNNVFLGVHQECKTCAERAYSVQRADAAENCHFPVIDGHAHLRKDKIFRHTVELAEWNVLGFRLIAQFQPCIQREQRVVIAGPGTFSALLNALQMGFRTLAIEKRSGEVWRLLGEIKGDFSRFSALLEETRKKLNQAGESIDSAVSRTRTIQRKLSNVETNPLPPAQEHDGNDIIRFTE